MVSFNVCVMLALGLMVLVVEVEMALSKQKLRASQGAIGQGFELHGKDLSSQTILLATGATIFESLPDKCIAFAQTPITKKGHSEFNNTEDFFSSIASTSGLDASLQSEYTLKASVSAVTKNLYREQNQVSGFSLDIVSETVTHQLTQDCINDQLLSKKFQDDFNALPPNIKNPSDAKSWAQYDVFVKKYGSHIVLKVISGSLIHQYAVTRSSKTVTMRDLNIKACLSMGGLTEAGKVNVSVCAGVEKKDEDTVSKLDISTNLIVHGGTSKTRSEITEDSINAELIDKFIEEANTDPTPILYEYYPIYKLLSVRYYSNPQKFPKAVNLQQYLEGYLNFGCTLKRSSNGIVLQKFDHSKDSSSDYPSYECTLIPEGCHVDNDCHYHIGVWCACYGDSCVDYKNVNLASGMRKKIPFISREGWGSLGCTFRQGSLVSCKCQNTNHRWQVSWPTQNTDNALNTLIATRLAEAKDEKQL